MKKISIKNAEDDGVEYYILYPENAMEHKNLPKKNYQNNPDSKTKKTSIKKLSRSK